MTGERKGILETSAWVLNVQVTQGLRKSALGTEVVKLKKNALDQELEVDINFSFKKAHTTIEKQNQKQIPAVGTEKAKEKKKKKKSGIC